MIKKKDEKPDQVGMTFLARDAAVHGVRFAAPHTGTFSRNNNCRLCLAPPRTFSLRSPTLARVAVVNPRRHDWKDMPSSPVGRFQLVHLPEQMSSCPN